MALASATHKEQLQFAKNPLIAKRQRVDRLLTKLADPAAAIASGADGTASRTTQLMLLTGRPR